MKTKDKTLLDFQAKWEKLVDKAVDNYSSLSADERIWFTIQSLLGAVDNGGIISHYYNYGADHNTETIEDLSTLGFPHVADLLEEVNNLFPGGKPSPDIDERNEIISNWPEEYDDLLKRIDQKFYELEDELERKLIQHIETRILSL